MRAGARKACQTEGVSGEYSISSWYVIWEDWQVLKVLKDLEKRLFFIRRDRLWGSGGLPKLATGRGFVGRHNPTNVGDNYELHCKFSSAQMFFPNCKQVSAINFCGGDLRRTYLVSQWWREKPTVTEYTSKVITRTILRDSCVGVTLAPSI